jgi:hypothetical protein
VAEFEAAAKVSGAATDRAATGFSYRVYDARHFARWGMRLEGLR